MMNRRSLFRSLLAAPLLRAFGQPREDRPLFTVIPSSGPGLLGLPYYRATGNAGNYMGIARRAPAKLSAVAYVEGMASPIPKLEAVMTAVQPVLFSSSRDLWERIRDGNPSAMCIFRRHYSCTNIKPKIQQFIGPGEKLALLTPDARALFCWRRERFRFDKQEGVNCTVFRNEGAGLSSELIRDADRIAWDRWPGERHFTFVDARRVRSKNPGYCFLMAGWRRCGVTQSGLLIFEILAPCQ